MIHMRIEQKKLLLSAHAISKSFGETPALHNASIIVKEKEIVAIMGPSGSGKSTLLHCLAGILTPDSGEILFQGTRIDTMNDEKRTQLRRTSFGFVFQFGQLVPELTALENVALPLMLDGVNRHDAFKCAQVWFKSIGLQGLEQHRVGAMSGGQAQRVALARSLIGDPKILFADEPTGALDSFNSDRVMELLLASVREHNVSVVLVTHDPRVAAYADREIIVRDGTTVDENHTL